MKTPPTFEAADIYVKYESGSFVTNTVRGQRASSTTSAERAAGALATKLFGDRLFGTELIGRADISMIDRFLAKARLP